MVHVIQPNQASSHHQQQQQQQQVDNSSPPPALISASYISTHNPALMSGGSVVSGNSSQVTSLSPSPHMHPHHVYQSPAPEERGQTPRPEEGQHQRMSSIQMQQSPGPATSMQELSAVQMEQQLTQLEAMSHSGNQTFAMLTNVSPTLHMKAKGKYTYTIVLYINLFFLIS